MKQEAGGQRGAIQSSGRLRKTGRGKVEHQQVRKHGGAIEVRLQPANHTSRRQQIRFGGQFMLPQRRRRRQAAGLKKRRQSIHAKQIER